MNDLLYEATTKTKNRMNSTTNVMPCILRF